MTWKIKTDPETKAPVMEDGKIVYIDPEGTELPLDPPAMYQKITTLGKQNKTDRTNYKTLRDRFAPFKDIEDIEKWKADADKALEDVQNFDDKDWMSSSKVKALKDDMKESYEGKLKAKDTLLGETTLQFKEDLLKKEGQIRTLMVSNKFTGSLFFGGTEPKTTLTPEIAESFFGKHYKVEIDEKTQETNLRAFYSNGDPILSKVNPGEPAEFEEAMSMIIDKYPGKDNILVASGAGSGGHGGSGDEHDLPNELEKLKKRHKEAVDGQRTTEAVALKNQIFALQQKVNNAA